MEVSRFQGYEVHTLQVNVPIGDCSIHLLVTNTLRRKKKATDSMSSNLPKYRQPVPFIDKADSETNKRGTVIKAILVDGGQDDEVNYHGFVAAKRILRVISDIESLYNFKHDENTVEGTPLRSPHHSKANQLVFDAWIVTHWDRDHWCGSLQMIHDDINAGWERWDAGQKLSSYFRYGQHNECLSTLYAATWDRPDWATSSAARRTPRNKPKGAPFIFAKDPVPFTSGVHSYQCARINIWGRGGNTINPLDYFEESPDTDGIEPRPLSGWKSNCWSNGTQNIATFITEAARRHGLSESLPLFLCIGACGSVFGYDAQDARLPKRCTVDNYQSIMSVTAWWKPNQHTTTLHDIRLSHFTAGDAHGVTEDHMLNFLKPLQGVGKPIPIEVLKAGHHGSRESTSAALLNACQPKKVIISAGRKHGHPSWQLVVLLVSYFRRQKKAALSDPDNLRWRERPLINTRFPYYMYVHAQTLLKVSQPTESLHPELFQEFNDVDNDTAITSNMLNVRSYWDEDWATKFSQEPFQSSEKTEKGLIKTWNEESPEDVAKYLYYHYPAVVAINKAFEMFKTRVGSKSNARLSNYATEFRPMLARLLRYFWDEMSSVGVFNHEFKKQSTELASKLHYIVLIATREPDYDGRVLHVGPHSGVPGCRVWSRPYVPEEKGNKPNMKTGPFDALRKYQAPENQQKWIDAVVDLGNREGKQYDLEKTRDSKEHLVGMWWKRTHASFKLKRAKAVQHDPEDEAFEGTFTQPSSENRIIPEDDKIEEILDLEVNSNSIGSNMEPEDDCVDSDEDLYDEEVVIHIDPIDINSRDTSMEIEDSYQLGDVRIDISDSGMEFENEGIESDNNSTGNDGPVQSNGTSSSMSINAVFSTGPSTALSQEKMRLFIALDSVGIHVAHILFATNPIVNMVRRTDFTNSKGNEQRATTGVGSSSSQRRPGERAGGPPGRDVQMAPSGQTSQTLPQAAVSKFQPERKNKQSANSSPSTRGRVDNTPSYSPVLGTSEDSVVSPQSSSTPRRSEDTKTFSSEGNPSRQLLKGQMLGQNEKQESFQPGTQSASSPATGSPSLLGPRLDNSDTLTTPRPPATGQSAATSSNLASIVGLPPQPTTTTPSSVKLSEAHTVYLFAADSASAALPLSSSTLTAIKNAESAGIAAKHPLRLAEPATPSQIFLGCTGTLLLQQQRSSGGVPVPISEQLSRYSISVSEFDATRRYIASTWRLRDDSNGTLIHSMLRSMAVQIKESVPVTGASSVGDIPGYLQLTGIEIQIAKDANSRPLVFTSEKKAINAQFEAGIQTVTNHEITNPGVIPSLVTAASNSLFTDVSSIDRFPGSLVLALAPTSMSSNDKPPTNGGFNNLGDLLSLVGLSAEGWVKTLLIATEINLHGNNDRSATNKLSTPCRNAIWYSPIAGTTCIRLEATVSLSSKIGEFIGKYLKGFESLLRRPIFTVIAKRTSSVGGYDGDGYNDAAALKLQSELILCLDLDIGEPRSVGVYMAILEDSLNLMLVCYSTAVNLSVLKDWLSKNCEGISEALSRLGGTLEKVSQSSSLRADATNNPKPKDLSGIYWRRATASISGEGFVQAVHVELEASVGFLVPRHSQAGFNIKFSWQPGRYEFDCEFMGIGKQMDEAILATYKQRQNYMMGYERWEKLEPLIPSEPFMSLRYLNRDTPLTEKEIPYGVPTEISRITLDVSNIGLSFETSLQSLLGGPDNDEATGGASQSKDVLPALRLAYVDFNVVFGMDYSSKPVRVSGKLEGVIGLEPRNTRDPRYPLRRPAELRAVFQYGVERPGSWSFEASASRLRMTDLYSLFASGTSNEQTAVMGMLRTIILNNIALRYAYVGANTSNVSFGADLTISGLNLTASFLRASAAEWKFEAALAPARDPFDVGMKKVTLLQATSDLLGAEVAALLPDFIQGTELAFHTSSRGKDRLGIVCCRVNTSKTSKLVFGAAMAIGPVKVQFGQVSAVIKSDRTDDKASASGSATADPKTKAKTVVKRIIRVTLGPLPTMQSLPLVGALELPCDTVEFVWLSDDMATDELSALNGVLAENGGGSPIPTATSNVDEGLFKGYHFRLLGKGNVVVNYPFAHEPPKASTDAKGQAVAAGNPPATKAAATSGVPTEDGKSTTDVDSAKIKTPSKSTETASMTPIKKSKGSVSLNGVGVTFKNKVLRIHLDARVLVGPVGAGVKGLQVNFDLGRIKGLHDLLATGVSVDIQGFEMSVDRSPLLLAGALEHVKTANSNRFSGGIAISLKAITINALGMYEQVYAAPPMPAYDSFFVYGMVEGTLFTVGWAEIRGIIAAFGYNSRLRLPPVDQLLSFPLVSGFKSEGGVSILDALKTLTGDGGPNAWISPSMGSLWFAAGLVMRACQTLDINAVATLSLGPSQKEIGLLSRATACLPRGTTSDKALMLIDLSILGKLDLQHGELAIDGQINPTSFIFSRDCRPSGGFAIRTWFDAEEKNPHAGDWVVTFGGYHPSFRRPVHYPAPARLRIGWRVSSNLSVSGEAYAAITPGAVMAGTRLQAVFSMGSLGAYFDAHADFLVNMAPLHYEAVVAVSAGVSYEIRVWKLRKKFSVEVGARLELEGPPLGGSVHFNVSVISFSVDFGPRGRRGSPAALSLAEFLDLVLKESSDQGAKAKNPHTLTAISGRLATGGEERAKANGKVGEGEQETWLVRADAFVFQLRSPVPLSDYIIAAPTSALNISGPSAMMQKEILSRPMQLRKGDKKASLSSQLTIAAYPVIPSSQQRQQPPVPLRLVSETWDYVPSNFWGEFSPNLDDYLRPDKMAPTVSHLVGLVLRPPLPKLPKDAITLNKTIEQTWKAELPGDEETATTATKAGARVSRYTETHRETRESLQWSRVRGAMVPFSTVSYAGGGGGVAPRITREEVLDQFLNLMFPTEENRKPGPDSSGAENVGINTSDSGVAENKNEVAGEETPQRRAYRRISTVAPRVVMDQPQRYYRAPPTVFIS